MINSISNFLPSKLGKQTNSKNNYDKFNNYCFQICEIINDNCVKLDIGEENYVKILGYLHSSKWDKIIQNNCKHYFYNDLQLIINEYGDQWCKKDKIFSYNTLKNDNNNEMDIRISLYRTNKIPTEIFPPITKYNDIRKIRKTRFIKKNVNPNHYRNAHTGTRQRVSPGEAISHPAIGHSYFFTLPFGTSNAGNLRQATVVLGPESLHGKRLR